MDSIPKPEYPKINVPIPPIIMGILIAGVTLIAAVGSIIFIIASTIIGSGTYETYVPSFNTGDIEFVYGGGSGSRLYVRTTEKFDVGDTFQTYTFISASRLNNRDQFDVLNNRVNEVKNGYIVLYFGPFNTDCFAAYKNKELITTIKRVELGLPGPSDKWMCSGFDFANALKQEISEN